MNTRICFLAVPLLLLSFPALADTPAGEPESSLTGTVVLGQVACANCQPPVLLQESDGSRHLLVGTPARDLLNLAGKEITVKGDEENTIVFAVRSVEMGAGGVADGACDEYHKNNAWGPNPLQFLKKLGGKIYDGIALIPAGLELAGVRFPTTGRHQTRISQDEMRGPRLDNQGAYDKLAQAGIVTEIDLTKEGTAHPDMAFKAGLKYVIQIPIVDNTHPDDKKTIEFLDIMNPDVHPAGMDHNPYLPAYYHCEMGSGRTGYMGAAARIVLDHWDVNDAINEANTLGKLLPNQADALRKFACEYADGKFTADGYPPPPGGVPGLVRTPGDD